MRFQTFLCCALLAALAACSDDGASGGDDGGECPPFSSARDAVELGAVLGAGRDGAGAIYVVDEADGALRAFVGSETSLVRVEIVGSAQSNDAGARRDTLTVGARPRSYQLIVEREGDEVRMGRTFDVDGRALSVDQLHPTEVLEVIDSTRLDGAELLNLPTDVVVEYLARLPSDELLLVVRPDSPDGLDYQAFRVFCGSEDELVEREVVSVTRARDGGSTHVVFDLEGTTADAYFPVSLQGEPPAPTLEQEGDVATLLRLDPALHAELLARARFDCLE